MGNFIEESSVRQVEPGQIEPWNWRGFFSASQLNRHLHSVLVNSKNNNNINIDADDNINIDDDDDDDNKEPKLNYFQLNKPTTCQGLGLEIN
jgi:hypothetical protein